MTGLLQYVEQNIQTRRLLKRGQAVLGGVSGGLDSMTLLQALHKLSSRNRWQLTVAHFNHRHWCQPNSVTVTDNAVPAITGVAKGNGTLHLDLAGMPGLTYVLQATTNLISSGGWLPLATNVPGTNGFWQFSDTVTNNPQRFYRLELAP